MMADLPLVSIVTPSYNQARFLEATLRSVLEQDYPNLEYLVVDGASTDGSVDIIRRYASRLAWWVSEKDSGQAEAINKGFRRAKGEIIAWLNSDDLYLPGAVTSGVAALQANPAACAVYGDAFAVDAGGSKINLMRFRQYSLADLLSFKIICQPAVFIRRSSLEEAGFLDPTYHFFLDMFLWMKMAQKAPLVYVPQTWAAARFHPGAKNIALAASCGIEAHRIIDQLRTSPDFAGIIARNEKRIFSGVNRLDGFYWTDAGKPWQALGAYTRSFVLHPPTALADWKHIILACLSLIGLQRIRRGYDALRSRSLAVRQNDEDVKLSK